jgi:hypothetical protein
VTTFVAPVVLPHLTGCVAEPALTPGADAGAWAATVATVAAWPAAEPASPVIERRLYRATHAGPLRELILAALHDPLGVLDPRQARRDLDELLRPLRGVRATRPLGAAERAVTGRSFAHVAEIRALNSLIPEGSSTLPTLFGDLVEGLAALAGPVALSMVIAPPAEMDAERDFDDEDPELGDDPRAEGFRRVRFRLRLCAGQPIPASLRARVEALCLSRRPHSSTWRIGSSGLGHETLNRALRHVALDDDGHTDPLVKPYVAALTLSLPAPNRGVRRTVHGRPISGRLPAEGAALGRVARTDGRRAPWRLGWEQRRLHTFLAGASGCGKSTTMLRLALDDLEAGRMIVVIDPHGDLTDQIAAGLPAAAVRRVDPRRETTDALDMLDPDPGRAAAHLMSAVNEVWPADFSGPVWQRGISLSLRALAGRPDARATTLTEVERFIVDPGWRKRVIASLDDEELITEAAHEAAAWNRNSSGDASIVNWMAGKFTPLTRGPGRPLFDRAPSRDLESELRHGQALLVTLPLGLLGADTVRLTTRMFLTRLTTAIAAQAALPEAARRPVSLLIDEAHLVAGPALAGLTAQARKFGTAITIATQSPSQLGEHLPGILTNSQTLLLGRLPSLEAGALADRLGGPTARALPTLPRHHLVVALEDHDPVGQPMVLTPIAPPRVPAAADNAERAALMQRLVDVMSRMDDMRGTT